jgi:hypothetical protein
MPRKRLPYAEREQRTKDNAAAKAQLTEQRYAGAKQIVEAERSSADAKTAKLRELRLARERAEELVRPKTP